jgi:hypothetical protein
MRWLRDNAVASMALLIGTVTGACAAYAATESRIAVLEEKVLPIEEVRRNVASLREDMSAVCAVLGAKCDRGR